VLFVDSIDFGKGVLYLLEAFRRFKLTNAERVLIGGVEPGIRHLLRRYHGVFGYVPHVPHGDLAENLSDGDNARVSVFRRGLGVCHV
jgi:hypothetical protein